ncbi:hypothetical protein EV127DRAFT_40289 [Xylaria flabelliformis]|nr:hypothetical protein EV127DRAFT_40289 [Xylaria flabelliformis]
MIMLEQVGLSCFCSLSCARLAITVSRSCLLHTYQRKQIKPQGSTITSESFSDHDTKFMMFMITARIECLSVLARYIGCNSCKPFARTSHCLVLGDIAVRARAVLREPDLEPFDFLVQITSDYVCGKDISEARPKHSFLSVQEYGVQTETVVSYASRMRLIPNLLPLFGQSQQPRVLNILNHGVRPTNGDYEGQKTIMQ